MSKRKPAPVKEERTFSKQALIKSERYRHHTYLTYPFKTMTITQSYTGSTSHYPHTKGNYRDYPVDEGGKDTMPL